MGFEIWASFTLVPLWLASPPVGAVLQLVQLLMFTFILSPSIHICTIAMVSCLFNLYAEGFAFEELRGMEKLTAILRLLLVLAAWVCVAMQVYRDPALAEICNDLSNCKFVIPVVAFVGIVLYLVCRPDQWMSARWTGDEDL